MGRRIRIERLRRGELRNLDEVAWAEAKALRARARYSQGSFRHVPGAPVSLLILRQDGQPAENIFPRLLDISCALMKVLLEFEGFLVRMDDEVIRKLGKASVRDFRRW